MVGTIVVEVRRMMDADIDPTQLRLARRSTASSKQAEETKNLTSRRQQDSNLRTQRVTDELSYSSNLSP